ncbi:MAG: hypothetical protein VKQ33_02575 [Candidatus Sericytochromatia bacterium]|nr:hypothetical protein [Candidatus Sericytochromatia bacterium]
MLTTVTTLLIVSTLVQAARNRRQWEAYQAGKLTRGQMVNRITTTVLLAVGSLGLVVLKLLGL